MLPCSQFDITINSKPAGQIVFKLYDDVCPITSRNFCKLATGERGFGYKGSQYRFARVRTFSPDPEFLRPNFSPALPAELPPSFSGVLQFHRIVPEVRMQRVSSLVFSTTYS